MRRFHRASHASRHRDISMMQPYRNRQCIHNESDGDFNDANDAAERSNHTRRRQIAPGRSLRPSLLPVWSGVMLFPRLTYDLSSRNQTTPKVPES